MSRLVTLSRWHLSFWQCTVMGIVFILSTASLYLVSYLNPHPRTLQSEWIEYRNSCDCLWDVIRDKKIDQVDLTSLEIRDSVFYDPVAYRTLLIVLNALCSLAAIISIATLFKKKSEVNGNNSGKDRSHKTTAEINRDLQFDSKTFTSFYDFIVTMKKLAKFPSAKNQYLIVISPDIIKKLNVNQGSKENILAFEDVLLKSCPIDWQIARYQNSKSDEEIYLILCPTGDLADVEEFFGSLRLSLEVEFFGDSRSFFSAGCAIFAPTATMVRDALTALRISQDNGGNCVTMPKKNAPHSSERSEAI